MINKVLPALEQSRIILPKTGENRTYSIVPVVPGEGEEGFSHKQGICQGYGFQTFLSGIGYRNQSTYFGLEQGITYEKTDQWYEDGVSGK